MFVALFLVATKQFIIPFNSGVETYSQGSSQNQPLQDVVAYCDHFKSTRLAGCSRSQSETLRFHMEKAFGQRPNATRRRRALPGIDVLAFVPATP